MQNNQLNVNGLQPKTISAKKSTLDIWEGPQEYQLLLWWILPQILTPPLNLKIWCRIPVPSLITHPPHPTITLLIIQSFTSKFQWFFAKIDQFLVIYWKLKEYLTSKTPLNGYFLSIQILLNNKSAPSLKVLLVIERRKQARKHPQEMFLETSENFFMLKVLHVDFNLLDGNEKNIFSLRAAAQISGSCKIRSNCEAYQQLTEKLK